MELDETGVQNIHKANEEVGVLGLPTYNITALEKGETSTVLAMINTFGDIPCSMVIHKSKNVLQATRSCTSAQCGNQ